LEKTPSFLGGVFVLFCGFGEGKPDREKALDSVNVEKFAKMYFFALTGLVGGVYIPAQRGRGAAGGC